MNNEEKEEKSLKFFAANNKFGKVSDLFLNAGFSIWLGSKNKKQTNNNNNRKIL